MLQITRRQMAHFRDAAARHFEDLMVAHTRDFAAHLYDVIGPSQMRLAVTQALARAHAYGFTFRGPLRLYVELTLLYGSRFDDDPQYPALRAILTAPYDQMLRSQQIYDHVVVYSTQVAGPDASNVYEALQMLAQIARAPNQYKLSDLDARLLEDMTRGFPQKAAYVTEPNILRLIGEGREEARQHGFQTARAQALIPILKYAFGHGCTDDPLYPWIQRTLTDPRIVDATRRAQRLERKAITWLDHVLKAQAPHHETASSHHPD